MLFNSFEFIFAFLPATLVVYVFLNKQRLTTAATVWLVFASLFFYSWWDVRYLALIIGSILFNFGVGTALTKIAKSGREERTKKAVLLAGILGNVLLLGYYKYVDFFIGNINALTGLHLAFQKIILPLGISFFTFTQIAYLVDTYAGRAKEYDFLNYALFVTFFPHLLAGPIIHHREMMPQFASKRNKVTNYRNWSVALFLFFIGLFKKAIIADSLSRVANAGFDASTALTMADAWAASLSYTLQLYFDFSAYTDMALAASLLFNIRLPFNFNSPYKATDISDFWRRWHMTLSRFLRDYIYIPLGGNRQGNFRTYVNLMATFLVGGLWHGAGWTFVFWGFLHGAATVVHRFWDKWGMRLPRFFGWFITFNFVNVAWVFFRAKTWGDALRILKGMCGLNGIPLSPLLWNFSVTFGSMIHANIHKNIFIILVLLSAIAVFAKNSNEMSQTFKTDWKSAAFVVFLAVYTLLGMNRVTEFLYFNF